MPTMRDGLHAALLTLWLMFLGAAAVVASIVAGALLLVVGYGALSLAAWVLGVPLEVSL